MAIALVLFSIISWKLTFIARAETTTGEVLDHLWKHGPKGYYCYSEIRFQSADYQITFTGPNNLYLNIGDEVKVIYLKSNPEQAYIYSFKGFWLSAFIYSIIPLSILLGASVAILYPNEKLEIDFSEKPYFKRTLPTNKKIT